MKVNIIIDNDKIEEILNSGAEIELSNFKNIVDCENFIVAPGFIDAHSHSELAAINKHTINPKFRQGITTEIVGNCGLSVAPVTTANRTDWSRLYQSIWGNENVEWTWTDVNSYLQKINEFSWNKIETLIGYSTLRFYLTGLTASAYDNELLKKMEALIEQELDGGAIGVSIGIGYPPNLFAQKKEYELIARILKKKDKIFVAHLRDEGNFVLEAIDEFVGFAEKSKCKLHISHLKAYGKNNWNKTETILKKIDNYNKYFDITFDSYPYTAGSTTLTSLLPPELLKQPKHELISSLKSADTRNYIKNAIENGLDNWENYAKTVEFENIAPTGLQSPEYMLYEGKTLKQLSKHFNKHPVDILCDILIAEKCNASMIMYSMNEDNVISIFKHPKHLVGSDGLFSSKPHPRTFGAFPRVINRLCKELKIMDLITALYQMTKFPADRFNLKNIGDIKKNYYADIIIFDYEKIKDTATYKNPMTYPEGIYYIILNGKIHKF